MSQADVARLREITTFPQLLKYLKNDLEWPIEADDLEEITFDYEPEELGLDPKTAVKIKEIKQLRPLSEKQPWGIFFVNFAPKRLPVVVLRRILGSLVLKNRPGANKGKQAAWKMHDLLFVSAYGENDERAITFAHFSGDSEHGDLPSLRVLGWDGMDTVLHIDHAAETLKTKLHWPKDDSKTDDWRKTWSEAFDLRHGQVIGTSKELAVRLAELAQGLRRRVNKILEIETDNGPMRRLYKTAQETLIHDLKEDDFADMYAQTITYGLFSARVTHDTDFRTDKVSAMVPETNPFLRELLDSFLVAGKRKGKVDFDELGIHEVVDMLRNADMEAVLRDFGKKNPLEDPVIHFYELFLKEYDAKKKMQRGVFYTPKPVVSFIVRSVHELLQKEFGLEDGLADTTTWGEMAKRNRDIEIPKGVKPDDPFVTILDPATGTGTFLVEAIEVIYDHLQQKWAKKEKLGPLFVMEKWNDYVPKHLLPRLYGYELMMAPYAIAHMKVGLKLKETGYQFKSKERAQIYLTNALEEPKDFSGQFADMVPALAQEAEAVNEIKRKRSFTVVIGNPPYASISANMQPETRRIIDPYRFVDGKAIKEKGALQFEKNLNDDYVKFIRFAELRVENSIGIVGMITNNAFLESATLRGMRSHLLDTFGKLWLIDLHGDADKREKSEYGQSDDNVFDIKHGVAISILSKNIGAALSDRVKGSASRIDIKSPQFQKYQWLLSHTIMSVESIKIDPRPEKYIFIPTNLEVSQEYDLFVKIDDILKVNSTGFESGRDELLTAFTKEELREKILFFCNESIHSIKNLYSVSDGWGEVLFARRKEIANDREFEDRFRRFLFGPFDIRWCFYRKDILKTNSFSAGKHLCYGPNTALIVMRQVSLDSNYTHFGISKYIVNNRCFYSTKGKISYFPVYLYSGESDLVREEGQCLGANVRKDFFLDYLGSLGFSKIVDKPVGEKTLDILSPDDFINYIYAVSYSPAYRLRYAEVLKSDFPRLPLTRDKKLFQSLSLLGQELVALHLMESQKLSEVLTVFGGSKSTEISRVGWSANTVWIDAKATKRGQPAESGTVGFKGVHEAIWNYEIGGYQVCEKWLKDRKGRKLSKADIEHYQKIVVAISETIRIQKEIDEVIEKHGGWPGAFVTGGKKAD